MKTPIRAWIMTQARLSPLTLINLCERCFAPQVDGGLGQDGTSLHKSTGLLSCLCRCCCCLLSVLLLLLQSPCEEIEAVQGESARRSCLSIWLGLLERETESLFVLQFFFTFYLVEKASVKKRMTCFPSLSVNYCHFAADSIPKSGPLFEYL